MIGSSVGSRLACEPPAPWVMSTLANCPVSVSAEPASTSPISIEPESPMKIRAGKKLCGRKPDAGPAQGRAQQRRR